MQTEIVPEKEIKMEINSSTHTHSDAQLNAFSTPSQKFKSRLKSKSTRSIKTSHPENLKFPFHTTIQTNISTCAYNHTKINERPKTGKT